MRPTRVGSGVGRTTSATRGWRCLAIRTSPAVALQAGGQTARLPDAAEEVGGGEDFRVVGTSAKAG
jgi:hypothetical protein